MRHRFGAFACLFAGLLAVGVGCSIDNPGVRPPVGALNFPLAIALDRDAGLLYVANSNFDLRYNAGSLQSYRVAYIESAVAGCGDPPCILDEQLDSVRVDEVLIGSHVSGLALSPDSRRLYLSVRSDSNLTYVDVDAEGHLDCGQPSNSRRCADSHRRGDESVASERGVSLPSDPVGVVAGDAAALGGATGDYVLMAHRGGRVSLFLEEAAGGSSAPTLVHVLTGLSENLVNLSLAPDGIAWVSSTSEAGLFRVGVAVDDETGELLDSFLFDAGALGLVGLDVAGRGDTRDVAFDPRPEVDRVYALSRRPESVLIADRAGAAPGDLNVTGVVPIGFGPSRLDLAEIDLDGDGTGDRTLLFASCFDSRDVWVVDPDLGTAVTVIRGMSGPFELTVDPATNLLYIADFRASVIRVADLAPMVDCLRDATPMPAEGLMGLPTCEPRTVVTLGDPRPVRDLL